MRPRSVEGRSFAEAAQVLIGQRRAGFSGMTGLDANACLALLEGRGCDPQYASLFLPWWEAGMLDAAAQRREENA